MSDDLKTKALMDAIQSARSGGDDLDTGTSEADDDDSRSLDYEGQYQQLVRRLHASKDPAERAELAHDMHQLHSRHGFDKVKALDHDEQCK